MKETQLLQFRAYDYLKDLIVNNKLERGVIHSQKKVAEELGISKTPLRDAVMRLEQERYIDVYPSKGFVVHQMTAEDIRETYQIRGAIEAFCLKLLAADEGTPEGLHCLEELRENIGIQSRIIATTKSNHDFARKDYEYHKSIVRYVGNETMLNLYKDFMHRIFWQTELSFLQQGRMDDTLKEHKQILEAIEKNDRERLEAIFDSHLMVAQNINLKLLEEQKSCEQRNK